MAGAGVNWRASFSSISNRKCLVHNLAFLWCEPTNEHRAWRGDWFQTTLLSQTEMWMETGPMCAEWLHNANELTGHKNKYENWMQVIEDRKKRASSCNWDKEAQKFLKSTCLIHNRKLCQLQQLFLFLHCWYFFLLHLVNIYCRQRGRSLNQ